MATEKRLIEVNALIAYFEEQCDIAAKDTEIESTYVLAALKCCIDLFQNFPTVDAVEVVHGQWIVKHNPITDPKGYFIRIVCSQCDLHTGQKSNYCPQCGAKMDR